MERDVSTGQARDVVCAISAGAVLGSEEEELAKKRTEQNSRTAGRSLPEVPSIFLGQLGHNENEGAVAGKANPG